VWCVALCKLCEFVLIRAGYVLCSSGVTTTKTNTAAQAMSERRNTLLLLCCFDPASPRLTAYDIHEWIHSQLQVLEHTVSMIQIDGIRRQVYIRFIDLSSVHDILRAINGETVYKHVTGEVSLVRLMEAGMGSKRIRLANLSPEVSKTISVLLCRNLGPFKPYRKKPGQSTIVTMFLME
jgi:hypothetical protein